MATPSVKIGGYDVPHEQIVAAAKKTRCDDFITALPDGYNTVIGEGGASLSGGEAAYFDCSKGYGSSDRLIFSINRKAKRKLLCFSDSRLYLCVILRNRPGIIDNLSLRLSHPAGHRIRNI